MRPVSTEESCCRFRGGSAGTAAGTDESSFAMAQRCSYASHPWVSFELRRTPAAHHVEYSLPVKHRPENPIPARRSCGNPFGSPPTQGRGRAAATGVDLGPVVDCPAQTMSPFAPVAEPVCQFRMNPVNIASQSRRKQQAVQGFGRLVACSRAGHIAGSRSGRRLPARNGERSQPASGSPGRGGHAKTCVAVLNPQPQTVFCVPWGLANPTAITTSPKTTNSSDSAIAYNLPECTHTSSMAAAEMEPAGARHRAPRFQLAPPVRADCLRTKIGCGRRRRCNLETSNVESFRHVPSFQRCQPRTKSAQWFPARTMVEPMTVRLTLTG